MIFLRERYTSEARAGGGPRCLNATVGKLTAGASLAS